MKVSKRMTKQTLLAAAVTASLGTISYEASALNLEFSWSGWFTMADPTGAILANTSITGKGANQFQTPVTGTLTYDTVAGTGSATLVPFDFFSGSLPAEAVGITLESIGDGMGGPGNLLLSNMLFNWNGTNGIPVSVVFDASGMLNAITSGISVGDTIASTGTDTRINGTTVVAAGTPSSDGTYANAAIGYLNLGPTPVATMDWNTTNVNGCLPGDCMNNPASGGLPLITDTDTNLNRFNIGLGTLFDSSAIGGGGVGLGIGGNPMQDGPFSGNNANFDITQMTLTSDGTGSITAPADVSTTIPETPPLPATSPVDLGPPSNVSPPGTAEYCTDGSIAACDAVAVNGWIADDGTNTIQVPITQTINIVNVDWRAGGGAAFDTQTATVTVNDTVPPVIDSTNAPAISVNVDSTADLVCFGAISATDAVEPTLVTEWSHDGFNWNLANPDTGNLNDNCSTGFGPDANTMNWRVTDVAGNVATYQQSVTLNLPLGVTGRACTIDLATAGARLLEGEFTMRDPTGAIAGSVDPGVTGDIDTTVFCTDPDIANCNPNPPAVTLNSGQPFFGFDWTASPVRLFDQGVWTFESCPFPRTFDAANNDWIGADGSTKCNDEFTPNPISMTVGPSQLGAHMLFDWTVNVAIDVVVVWDVDCNKFELTTTDPDGDGILSTQMVDGPFKGFNAAFDLKTQAGEPLIADGGYTVTTDAIQNPVAGESPLVLNTLALPVFTADASAVRSCVGDCIKFSTSDLMNGNDAGGAYQYAQIVHPLTEATPFWSLYRKYDEATMTWGPFVIDGRNDIKTAALDPVANECPEPGNGSYDRPITGSLADKLRSGDLCLQITIEDNGPNDTNPAVGVIDDPGGVAEVPAPPVAAPATGGGCSMQNTQTVDPAKGGAWWLLAGLLGWLGWRNRRA